MGPREPSEEEEEEYVNPGEVARLLHVSPKTINRWADAGLIPCIVTLGGHRRFRRADVESIAAKMFGTEQRRRRPS